VSSWRVGASVGQRGGSAGTWARRSGRAVVVDARAARRSRAEARWRLDVGFLARVGTGSARKGAGAAATQGAGARGCRTRRWERRPRRRRAVARAEPRRGRGYGSGGPAVVGNQSGSRAGATRRRHEALGGCRGSWARIRQPWRRPAVGKERGEGRRRLGGGAERGEMCAGGTGEGGTGGWEEKNKNLALYHIRNPNPNRSWAIY
jgi:hypothetical protein